MIINRSTQHRSARVLVRLGAEPVTHARLVEQVAGSGGVWLELAAQLCHVEAEIALGVLVARAPDLGEELTLAQQLSRVLEQDFEKVPLRRRETDVDEAIVVLESDPFARQVDRHGT